MSWAAVAGAGASVIGSQMSANQAAASQGAANEYNVSIEEARMNEQARQLREQQLSQQEARSYDASRYSYEQQAGNERTSSRAAYGEGQLSPYTTAGKAATEQQQALLGLSGAEAGAAAMAKYNQSPGMEFLQKQQEKATLRNAAATGGLRGGNTQTALQENAFGRAQTDYGNYYNRLAGLSGVGANAAGQLASQYGGVSTTAAPVYTPRELEKTNIAITRPGKDKKSGTDKLVDRYGDVGSRMLYDAAGSK